MNSYLVAKLLAVLDNDVGVMVLLLEEDLALLRDIGTPLSVNCQVGLEGIMFLDEPLDGSHVIFQVGDGQQLLLLRDPGLLLLNLGKER